MDLHRVPLVSSCSPPVQAVLREALTYRGRVLGCFALLVLGAALAGGKFLLLERLIQAGLDGRMELVGVLLAATVACWMIGHCACYAALIIGMQFERFVGTTMVHRALGNLLDRSPRSMRQIEANHAVHFLRTGLTTISRVLRSMLNAVTQLVIALFGIAACFWLEPIVGGICLVSGLPAMAWAARHIRKQQRGKAQAMEAERQLHLRLCRVFEALPQVKLYGAGPQQFERLTDLVRKQKRGDQMLVQAQRRTSLEMNLIAALTGLLIVAAGGWLMTRGAASVAGITALLALHQSVFVALRLVLSHWGNAEENSDFLTKLQESRKPLDGQDSEARPVMPLTGRIATVSCTAASFAVGETVLIAGVSCRLEAGRLYGVAGPSGSGKSMLLHLLSGHSRPKAGELRFNDLDVRNLDPEDLGMRIALVSWPPLLLDGGTLADNLRLARPEATDDELIDTLGRVAFTDDLTRLNRVGGLAAILGREGVQLSVGQLQRLALARALLRAPEVLLLDEPLTGLDPLSAEQVLDSLAEYAETHLVVLVAPTATVLRRCDELLITDAGRLIAQAPVATVMEDARLRALAFPEVALAA